MRYLRIDDNANIVDKYNVILFNLTGLSYTPFEIAEDLKEEYKSSLFKPPNTLSIDKVLQLVEAGLTHDQIIDMKNAGVI